MSNITTSVLTSLSENDDPIPQAQRVARRKNVSASNKRLKWSHPLRLIKTGIWIYFLLVIVEGAVRKWVLPGLSTPLLVVRDPIAMAVLWLAFKRGLLPLNTFVISFVVIAMIGSVTAIGLGHGSAFVAAFGARTMLIHVPLAFVIGRTLQRNDLIKIGRSMVWIVIPMTILIAMQFYSPQSAWVNRGVGGDLEGAGFSGALGFQRPPGTFSFTNGVTSFYGMVSGWIVYFWLVPRQINRWLLWLATGCLLLAIPLSISRSLLFQVAIAIMFAGLVIGRKPQYLGKMLLALAGIGVAMVAVSFIPAFKTATTVLSTRFENASRAEGGLEGTLVDRFLGGLVVALFSADDVPLFGRGIGLGTNIGAQYASGSRGFLVAEGEWGRTVGELGALLGLSVIFLRISMAGTFMFWAYKKLTRSDPLPWMLMSFGFLLTAIGGWAQPTALGFYTIGVGMVLAALRTRPGTQRRRRRHSQQDTKLESNRSTDAAVQSVP